MHYEFAVEPQSIVKNFETFCYFIEKFGAHTGRLVSEFPKKWKRMIFEASKDFSEMHQKRVSSELRKATFLVASGREYTPELTWSENAQLAHNIRPFHAILTKKPFTACNAVICLDDLLADPENKFFKVSTEYRIPKTPEAFKLSTKTLIFYAKELIFIDPYLGSSGSYDVLKAILENVPQNIKIQYITSASPKGETLEYREDNLKQKLPKNIPIGFGIEVLLINKSDSLDTHNRYIITDKGAIKFPYGLDAKENKKDVINLMQPEPYQEIYEEFTNIAPENICSKFSIQGTRMPPKV